MLKYLIIPLSDDAVSFCHYEPRKESPTTIAPDSLKEALHWAMKENLSVQFLYPSSGIPAELEPIINSIDHIDIVPADINDPALRDSAGIVVINGWENAGGFNFKPQTAYIVRSTLDGFIGHPDAVREALTKADRLNAIITDVENFGESHQQPYGFFLESLIPTIIGEYVRGHQVQFNLLTDRIMLAGMNNCNAGNESLTLAPDGQLYICPAFYADGSKSIGSTADNEPAINNPELYRLSHAPLCRICDAFHCKRCVWMNRRLTNEVNTPGRQQCVIAHIERNASRKLLKELRAVRPEFMTGTDITEINYLDPLDKIDN